MKRFLTIVLCFVFVFLCACSKSNTTDTTTSIQSSTKKDISTQPTSFSQETTQPEPTTVEIPTSSDDPYSAFIKNWYEEIYEAQKDSGAEYFGEFDKHSLDCYYFIYDIDGNGVDELILGDWKRVGGDIEDPNPPKKIMINSIYTLKDGVLIEQDLSNWWKSESILERSILSNGAIITKAGNENNPGYLFSKFVIGSLIFKYAISYTGDIGGNRYYKIIYTNDNGEYIEEKITKEEFERLRDEANGDAQPIEINWKRIDEYGR